MPLIALRAAPTAGLAAAKGDDPFPERLSGGQSADVHVLHTVLVRCRDGSRGSGAVPEKAQYVHVSQRCNLERSDGEVFASCSCRMVWVAVNAAAAVSVVDCWGRHRVDATTDYGCV